MASCVKNTKTIEETVQVVKKHTVDDGVTLKLTDAEAQTLSQLLSKTGGHDRATGHRNRLASILSSLQSCGFNVNYELPAIGTGWIYAVENVPDVVLTRTTD